MTRKISLILMAVMISAMIAWPVAAQKKERVIILPFEILSRDDLGDMGQQVKNSLAATLAGQGAQIIALPEAIATQKSAAEAAEDAREFGREQGADYVVWGSMTWLDDLYSLDTKMVRTFAQFPIELFFDKGRGAETVLATVQKLGGRLGIRIFKRSLVARIVIEGNHRVEDDAIRRQIETRTGEPFLAKTVSEDLKRIFAMGFFSDIRVASDAGADGEVITFYVTENPTIREIRFMGNDAYNTEKLNEELDIQAGSVMNRYNVERNIKRLEDLYKEKNYHNVKIDYTIETLENNQADLEFEVVEGERALIREITFSGNSNFSDMKLKKVMRTSEKGVFSWITSSGDLNMEDLDQDALRIKTFYQNEGFIEARVGDPEVSFEEDGIYIAIKVFEGARYEVGRVILSGDDIAEKEQLIDQVKITNEPFYNLEILRNDILQLKDIYADKGYAFAEIFPDIDRDRDNRTVNIDLQINKGAPVFFEKIIIQGNKRTRDKVIRRELGVYEQGTYSGVKLKRGIRNLYRLGYFDDVQVNTAKGGADDQMILTIEVKERSTGNFQIGGGYSSADGFFVSGGITESNFLGKGWVVNLSAEVGDTDSRFKLSFTEPWLFDIPLAAGFDIYRWEREYNTYDKESTGGGFRTGYPILPDTRFTFRYNYDVSEVSDVDEDASRQIQELTGEYATSSVTGSLRYDTRNHAFLPDRGQDHRLSIEYAGIGGDIKFIKYIGELGVYFPLFKGLVLFLHSEGGYVTQQGGELLPDYERFYLGGINSLRGFEHRGVTAEDEEGLEIGGEQYVQGNVELIIPLLKAANVNGVLFYDTGNVFGEDEDIDLGNLRQTAGYGIRWFSPVGPIRLERGHILDPEEDEDSSGRWQFSIGAMF